MEEVCSISHECFVIPPGYKRLGMNRGRALVDEEEELLQLAIQQSLMDQGGGAEQVSQWVGASDCLLEQGAGLSSGQVHLTACWSRGAGLSSGWVHRTTTEPNYATKA